jgi:4-hydroxy-2-oxoheptanedioate aldolase
MGYAAFAKGWQMDLQKNHFKAALKDGRQQIGLWNTIAGNCVPEALAHCGFDWLVVDTEHAPVETVEIQSSLQAIAAVPSVSAVVRPAANDPILIKRILDMGAQTLLLPYIQSAAEARAAVSAMRYGPRGIRGMAGFTRATRYGSVADYFERAEEELCLIVQVETITAMAELRDIATTEGVDAVFIGPADLSASMGYPGQTEHPEVVAVMDQAIEILCELGVPAGILAMNEPAARHFMNKGTSFTAVGVDMTLLATAARSLRATYE